MASPDPPRRVALRDRLLVEWVAEAKVGAPFPEPWSQASKPRESIICTLVELGVIEMPAPGTDPATVAREASAAAERWLRERDAEATAD